MISGLRSIAVAVTPIALDIYDREDPLSLLPLLAQFAGNPDKEKTVNLEWLSVFPELRKWIGERTVQRAFKDNLKVDSEPYEITMEFDRRDAERKSGLVKAEKLAADIARAFSRGKVQLAYQVLRSNAVTYDGSSFFDFDHTHPNGSPFNNLLPVVRANPTKPTVAEARYELKLATAKLMENRLVRNELVSTAEIDQSLVVITRSFNVWSAYRDLNTETMIGTEPNRFKGTFHLLRDFKPNFGDDYSVDVIEALPNGPRPVVFVVTSEPTGLAFDLSKEFSHKQVPFGMDGEYGAAAGFPQTAVRVINQAE
jgi:hypothetical protein